MARKPRLVIAGYPMHVVLRGNNRQAIFFSEADYQTYLDCIADALEKYLVDVHAYVLMTNHVHLLLTPYETQALSRFIQAIGRRYVRYVNSVYKRTGTLWEGRYKSAVIDSVGYLLTCYRYVEMNPVRARMVKRPDDYRWSSFNRNALGVDNELIKSHQQYDLLGTTDKQRQENYLSFFNQQLTEDDITEIRHGTLKKSAIGNERFKNEIEKVLGRKLSLDSHGGDRKSKEFLAHD